MEYKIYYTLSGEDYDDTFPGDLFSGRILTKDDSIHIRGDLAAELVKQSMKSKGLLTNEDKDIPKNIRFFRVSRSGEMLLWDGNSLQEEGLD